MTTEPFRHPGIKIQVEMPVSSIASDEGQSDESGESRLPETDRQIFLVQKFVIKSESVEDLVNR
jgi:hypothetical protein